MTQANQSSTNHLLQSNTLKTPQALAPSQMARFQDKELSKLLLKASMFIRDIGEHWVQAITYHKEPGSGIHVALVFHAVNESEQTTPIMPSHP